MSTPHCSFVIYLRQDLAALRTFVQDFRVFFQKFPLHYELIGVIDGGSAISESDLLDLQKNAPSNEAWQIHRNPRKCGRAQSLQIGLNKARAEIIILPSLVMATPLGDLFKILQTLMSDPELAACWGERYSKKTESMAQATPPALKLENLFNKILKEKNPDLSSDPLCEIGGLRKQAWQQIQSQIEVAKKKNWYFAHTCQRALRKTNSSQQNVFIHDSGQRPQDFSLWQARWELLRQSLFETL